MVAVIIVAAGIVINFIDMSIGLVAAFAIYISITTFIITTIAIDRNSCKFGIGLIFIDLIVVAIITTKIVWMSLFFEIDFNFFFTNF